MVRDIYFYEEICYNLNMINLLEKIIDETEFDNKLFARYGFKFYDCIEKNPEQSLVYLRKTPNFKNEFQLVFMSGLVDHFYKNNKPEWVSDKRLSKPWSYLTKYESDDYLPELTKRGIYVI